MSAFEIGSTSVVDSDRKGTLKIGGIYEVKHSRKGTFIAKVITDHDTGFVGLEVVKGKARAACEYNECDPGDSLTVRKGFCTFKEVDHV